MGASGGASGIPFLSCPSLMVFPTFFLFSSPPPLFLPGYPWELDSMHCLNVVWYPRLIVWLFIATYETTQLLVV